eukprot:Gb_01457 [translate_table: standard]
MFKRSLTITELDFQCKNFHIHSALSTVFLISLSLDSCASGSSPLPQHSTVHFPSSVKAKSGKSNCSIRLSSFKHQIARSLLTVFPVPLGEHSSRFDGICLKYLTFCLVGIAMDALEKPVIPRRKCLVIKGYRAQV